MPKDKKLIYVSLEISPQDTEDLKQKILSKMQEHGIKHSYKTMKGLNENAHITLCYYSDFGDHKEFLKFTECYDDIGSIVATIDNIAYDEHCVALCISKVHDLKNKKDVSFYPADKNLHITMFLNDIKPVYSNELIKRLKNKNKTDSFIPVNFNTMCKIEKIMR